MTNKYKEDLSNEFNIIDNPLKYMKKNKMDDKNKGTKEVDEDRNCIFKQAKMKKLKRMSGSVPKTISK